VGVTPTVPEMELDGEVDPDDDVELDDEPGADGDVDPDGGVEGGGLVDGDGLGEPDAGQVWVRLKKSADPVIRAVAAVNVQPAGVTIHAFAVAGPPSAKLPGSSAVLMVTVPLAPKVALTDAKSPLVACWPGRTNTHTSWSANGPPPWAHEWLSNPAAVVGTLPGLMLIVVLDHAGDPKANATTVAAATKPPRHNLVIMPVLPNARPVRSNG
jgi:hypothetical protein